MCYLIKLRDICYKIKVFFNDEVVSRYWRSTFKKSVKQENVERESSHLRAPSPKCIRIYQTCTEEAPKFFLKLKKKQNFIKK